MTDAPPLKQLYRERPDVMGLEQVEALPRAKDAADALLKLVERWRKPPYRTLDMGCGIGSVAIELGLRGHATLGYDAVPPFIEAAKGLAAKQGTYCNARFLVADSAKARPILDGLTFDLVLVLGGVLGESVDDAADAALLRDLAAAAAPGAVLVVEARNGAALAAGPGVREERLTATDAETGDAVVDVPYRTRVYSPAELSRAMNANGWGVVDARASLAGEALEPSSPRMVLVALRRADAGAAAPQT